MQTDSTANLNKTEMETSSLTEELNVKISSLTQAATQQSTATAAATTDQTTVENKAGHTPFMKHAVQSVEKEETEEHDSVRF